MAEFADRMRSLRGELSRRRVGHLLDIREEQIKKFEDGDAKPSYRTLHRLADATGASIDYITGRSDEFSGPPLWWSTERRAGDVDRRARPPTRADREARARAEELAARADRGEEPPAAGTGQ